MTAGALAIVVRLPVRPAQNCPSEVPISSQGRTSFTKRQKELSRQEKQRDKAARKAQRKLEKPSGDPNHPDNFTVDESAAAEQWNFPGAGDDPQVP